MLRRIAAIVGLALACGGAAGCGAGAGGREPISSPAGVQAQRAILQRMRAPRTGTSVLATSVVMFDERRGILIGVLPGGDYTSVVQRTTDGGENWETTHTEPKGSTLVWAGRDGRDVVAAGDQAILRSHDLGRSWSRSAARVHIPEPGQSGLSDRFAFNGHGIGLSLASPSDGYAYSGRPLLRTTDGGRTWRSVRLPGAGTPVGQASWVPGGRIVYVSGYTSRSHCRVAIWRSDDAGRRWQLRRGACGGLPLSGLFFRDARHGIASGGSWDPTTQSGVSIVRATDDAGAHWRTLWRQHSAGALDFPTAYALTELDFADARHGWALYGGIKDGANRPYGGPALVTSDGGHHWRRTDLAAARLSVAGQRGAFVVDPLEDFGEPGPVARTRDAGRSWTVLAGPQQMRLGLFGDRRGLTVTSEFGDFAATAPVSRWRRISAPPGRLLAARDGTTASIVDDVECDALVIRQPGNSTNRRRRVPGCRVAAFALAGGDRMLYVAQDLSLRGNPRPHVYASVDGGATWRLRSLLPRGSAPSALAADGDLVVAAGEIGPTSLAISRDGGRTWTALHGGGQYCSAAAVAGAEIWIGCQRRVLHSPDAGHSWELHDLPKVDVRDQLDGGLGVEAIVGLGPGHALVGTGGASLLETRDSGARWSQLWPGLPIEQSH